LGDSLSDRVAIGIVIGLLVGKPIGILAATWLVARLTKAELDSDLTWLDVLGLSVLAGVGFTVSLLIGELAFGAGTQRDDHVKVAILAGSVLAAIIAGLLLRSRNRIYDRIAQQERPDGGPEGYPPLSRGDRRRTDCG
jgi:NhaA family Na+:H+ antiporter